MSLKPSNRISKQQCQSVKLLYPDYDDLPEEVKQIIANMMFNMGRPRLSKFKGMKRGVDARDWNAAADEMVDSDGTDRSQNVQIVLFRECVQLLKNTN